MLKKILSHILPSPAYSSHKRTNELITAIRDLKKDVKDLKNLASSSPASQPQKEEEWFVRDYQNYVQRLINDSNSVDDAMSIAVGGNYADVGKGLCSLLLSLGLKTGMRVVDFGCGSGRLATSLPVEYNLDYLGIDIVDELLNYAASKSPKNYKFMRHCELSVPVESDSADIICAFSVFTHLLHHETYIYMEDMKRALKKDGILVFSFLEFGYAGHWPIFDFTMQATKENRLEVQNIYMEKPVVELFAKKLGFTLSYIGEGTEDPPGSNIHGHSIAVYKK